MNNIQNPIKIVYLINSLNMGGAQVGLCRILQGLDKNEYSITVIVLNGSKDEIVKRIPDWVSVIQFDGSVVPILKNIKDISILLKSTDVIVGSLYHSIVIARLCGVLNFDAKVITWQHSEQFKNKRRKQTIGLTNKLSDVVLADSLPVKEMYTRTFNVDSNFVKQVPISGIAINNYSLKNHVDSEPILIGTVGSLTPAKNYQALIQAAGHFSGDNIQFRIAGDGPLKRELKKEINKRKVNNIDFIGRIDNVPDFLGKIDIYFQPSIREGLCISVIEAMAAGLPIVGSDVGGIGMNVKRSKCGYVYHPNDVSGFVEAIETLSSDPSLRQELGSRGRALVKDAYTQEILVEEFENAIIQT